MNIMKFFGFENDEDDYDDNENYTDDRRKKSRSSRSSGSASAGKLIIYNYNGTTLSTDKLHLRDEFINNGAMILVDLHELSQREYDEEGKDFITFMGGLAFASEGETKFIDPAQYLFTPKKGMSEFWPEGSDKE